MIIMKKRFFFAMMALAALFVTVGFTSCGSDDDDDTPATKVTSAEVSCCFAYLEEIKGVDLSEIYTFAYDNADGDGVGYIARRGSINTKLTGTTFKVKDKDGNEVTKYCSVGVFDKKTITSFPATYTFTAYAKIWVNLDEADEKDIYDYLVSPYFLVKTNLDEKAKRVLAGDPGYTYIQNVDYRTLKTNTQLREQVEGKYTCTINFDKDGNYTTSVKFEKLDGTENIK